MKTKQFLLTLLLLLGGASFAWAEKFSPEAEILYRTNGDNTAWNPGFPKVASESNQTFEANYNAGIVGLQRYTVDDLANVSKLTLYLTGDKSHGTDALAIWSYPNNDWDASTSAATIAANVESTVGIALHASEGIFSSTYLLKDQQTGNTSDGDIRFRRFEIIGDALKVLKSRATDNSFTLLITTKTSELKKGSRRWFSNGHTTEAYRPYIVATYSNAAEMNGVGYTTLNEAINAAPTDGTETTITLNHDITITDRCNVTSSGRKVTVVPAKAGITISSTLYDRILLLCNSGGTLTIGCDEYELTIDGNNVTNSSNHVEASGGKTTIKNVRFRNCVTSDNKGVVCHKAGGEIHLLDVTFQDCSTTQSGRGIVFAGSTGLHLEGSITFENCNEYNFYQENGKYLNVGYIGSSQVAPFTTYYENAKLGNIILSSSTGENRSDLFKLMNDGMGIMFNYSTHPTDHFITEAYNMTISDAKAATLVLPYETKIPSGVNCYTLNYTAGNSSVKATKVATATLPANTPVLLNAEAGNYKFVNTSMVDAATTGSGTHTIGALTGVYETTNVPAESYILWANATNPIGFYKANSSTVAANRAYLTADGAGVRALTIDFSGEETGVNAIGNGQLTMDNAVYDLSGRRVSRPTKGLYIMNGKKVVLK